MSNDDIAAAVLECVGGFANVTGNSLCATRLRISLSDRSAVDRNALHAINGVLGIADRGINGIEVVFGPNLVRGVYQAFERLTGIFPGPSSQASETLRPRHNFRVQITPETPGAPQTIIEESSQPTEGPLQIDDDTSALLEMLDDHADPSDDLFEQDGEPSATDDDTQAPTADDTHPRLLVMNGPNLNMLGIREPELYGTAGYPALLELCHESAREAGFSECVCYQSNHEGDLVDCIQDAYQTVDAIVINPGAYTHTSIALLDALKAVQIPTIEVHISHVDEREEFRQVSYVRLACVETIVGEGIEGYRHAIFDLARHLGIIAS